MDFVIITIYTLFLWIPSAITCKAPDHPLNGYMFVQERVFGVTTLPQGQLLYVVARPSIIVRSYKNPIVIISGFIGLKRIVHVENV